MDDEKTGLLGDWPRPVNVDAQWALWMRAVQARIARLETVASGNAQRIETLEKGLYYDPAEIETLEKGFASASERLRHDEGMPSERAPLARSRMLEKRNDELEALINELRRNSVQSLRVEVLAHSRTKAELETTKRELAPFWSDAERERIAKMLGLPSSTSWADCERAIQRLRKTPASELVTLAQNETCRALDIAHATRERLRAVERELATVLKLCADLVEPIDVRRTPPVTP